LVSGYLFHLNCFNLISWCYIIHLKGGEKIKIGRQTNSEKKTPAWRWKDRFHRENPPFGGYAAYVSRPTFEDLRSSGKEGRRVFNAICKLLEMQKNSEPLSGRHYEERGLHSFAIVFPEEEINCIAVMVGPFDVSDEMDMCKRGILFHIILCGTGDEDDVLPQMPNLLKLPNDVYDLTVPFKIKLDSDLTDESDRTEWFKGVLEGKNSKKYCFYKHLNLDALDLSAARLLPSDVFIESLENKDIAKFEYCRRFMTRQFNEVRLLGDPTKPNIEQTNTMNAYVFNKSSAMNLNGRPGTGKSTILHMLTCESLLQLGPNLGSRRVLYLATTEELIAEARVEIKNLLKHLYLHKVKNSNDKLQKLLAAIDFATEEEFFVNAPGTLPLDDRVAFENRINDTDDDERWAYWKDPANTSLLQRILRNFVYGVFGSPSEFCKWVPTNRNPEEIKGLFKRPFNFFTPNEKYAPADGDLLSSDITPLYFWNPGFDTGEKISEGDKDAANHVRGLATFLEEKGGLGKYLIDYSIGKTTGLWDSSGVIHGIATRIHQGEGLRFLDSDSFPLWHQMQTKGYDSIIIDESQDFSARTIATLLQYFSNRGVSREENHLPFTFVCAGDEFQTIYGTLFQGAMIHINKIFTDWKVFLLKQSTGEMRSFADGLPNPVKISLRASYRTFDTAVKVIDNVVEQMREITLKEGQRRTVGVSKIGYERTGVMAGLQASGRGLRFWETVLKQLCKQLEKTFGEEIVQIGVKVALIFPKQRIWKKDVFCEELDSFSNLEHATPFKDYIEKMKNLIDNKYEDELALNRGDKEKANEKIVSMVKEAGFYDIAAIKGQTHVAVVALQPPINPDEGKKWFDRLLDLSLSLVMVSRSQIGLFIAASNSDTKKIIGPDNWNEFQRKNEYFVDSIGEISDFDDRLLNSAAPVISPEKLFAYALEEWYNPRAWERLRRSPVLGRHAIEFVGEIRQIFLTGRIKQPHVQSTFNQLEDLFEKQSRDEITAVLGGEAFFEDGAIHKLRHFLHWQIISREYYEGDDVGYELPGHIDELEKYWKENRPAVDEHTNNWMDLILNEDNSDVELLIGDAPFAPWNLDHTSILPTPFQHECHVPRLRIGPWKFTAPPEAKERAEFLASWVNESQHWSPSIEIIQRVIEYTLRGDNNSRKRMRIEWMLNHIRQDGCMLETSLRHYKSGNSETIGWVFRTTIGSNNPNTGSWFYDQLKSALREKLEGDDPSLLLSAISDWLTGLNDAQDIVSGLNYVGDLVKSDKKKSRKVVSNICANLDPSILVKWLKLVNANDISTVPDEIIALGGDKCRDMFANVNNLIVASNVKTLAGYSELPMSARMVTHGDFATSLFKVKIGSVRKEFQAPIRGELEDFIIAVFIKLLTDRTVPSSGGSWNLGDVRKEEIFNRLRKYDERECPRGDSGRMNRMRDRGEWRMCDVCQLTQKVGAVDESVEWFRDFTETTAGWSGHQRLIEMIQQHIRSARDDRFEHLMKNICAGKIPFEANFQTRDAAVIEIGSPPSWPYEGQESWRNPGHLFDWNILGDVRGIDKTPTVRFDTKESKAAIALNGKTFDGYMAAFRGEEDTAYNFFIRGGAIPEAQFMLLKSIQLGESPAELLNYFCQSMMLESQVYLAHVAGPGAHTRPMVITGWRDWKSLPNTILDGISRHNKDEWASVWKKAVEPYILQMNQYFKLGAFLDKMKSSIKENGELLSALKACEGEDFEVAVYKNNAFKIGLPTINKQRSKIYSTHAGQEIIICSTITTFQLLERKKIIDDFTNLLQEYQRASEEDDFAIYRNAIFKIISAPGLKKIFVVSLKEEDELDDSAKKTDARYVLSQYLQGLEVNMSPELIEMILRQIDNGKREDGLFSGADDDVREAYELSCSYALEKQE
jgi:hypothetical protein